MEKRRAICTAESRDDTSGGDQIEKAGLGELCIFFSGRGIAAKQNIVSLESIADTIHCSSVKAYIVF